VGWQLLRPGGYRAPGAGRIRRYGARRTGALQHAGGDSEVWVGVGEACGRSCLTMGKTSDNWKIFDF